MMNLRFLTTPLAANSQVLYTLIPTSWGQAAIIGASDRLMGLILPMEDVATVTNQIRFDAPSAERNGDLLPSFQKQVRAYFDDQPIEFSGPVDLSWAGPFARKVLRACAAIEPGRTVTYGQLAATINRPGAARAVGTAMARNRIPLVIPCHRVLGANGRLCGFSAAGGVDTKQRLLEWEEATACACA